MHAVAVMCCALATLTVSSGELYPCVVFVFFFSSRRRHTRCLSDWSSDVCSSDLFCLRSEEDTSELQALRHLVCRLLLENEREKVLTQGAMALWVRRSVWNAVEEDEDGLIILDV